jgi:hypothetical protein
MGRTRRTTTTIIGAAFAAAIALTGCNDAVDEEDIVDDNAPDIDQGTDAGDTSDTGERTRENEDKNEGVKNAGDLDDSPVYDD